jgi:hypothetical protein
MMRGYRKKLPACGCQLVLTAGWTGHQPLFFQRGELAANLRRLQADCGGNILGAGAVSAVQSLQNFALPSAQFGRTVRLDCLAWLRRRLTALTFFLAIRADAEKFNPAAGNAVADFSGGCRGHSLNSEVVNPVALDAVYMMVLLQLPVKTFLAAADFQFSDHTCFRQNFKISVNGGQTYARQFFFDPLVEQVGCRMPFVSAHFIKNHFALVGHSQRRLSHDFTFLFYIFYIQEIVKNDYHVKIKNKLQQIDS